MKKVLSVALFLLVVVGASKVLLAETQNTVSDELTTDVLVNEIVNEAGNAVDMTM